MSDEVQPGVKIDEGLWREFRENVKERKGGVRGHLRTEVENAIREYIRTDTTPTEQRIENRLSRIEQAVGAATTDGGTHTVDEPDHTHAPTDDTLDEKPPANAPTDKKVQWLAQCVFDEAGNSSGDLPQVSGYALRQIVKDEYGFRRDTAKRYVDELIDYFEFVEHPKYDDQYCSPERHDVIVERIREKKREQADEQLDDLDQ